MLHPDPRLTRPGIHQRLQQGVGLHRTGMSAFELLAMGLSWLAGLALLQRCERLPLPGEWLALSAGLLVFSAWSWRGGRQRWIALALSVGLLAFSQGAWRASLRLAQELHPAWEGRDLVLTGRIDSLPVAVLGQGGAAGWRFEFAVESSSEGRVPERLMLLAYSGQGEPGGAAPALTAGERWRWTVRLKRAHGLANPGGFDAELWLFEQNLRASGVVRPGSGTRLSAAPWWTLDAARQALRERLRANVADPALAGVLAALSVGDQAAISRADWSLFRDTAVAHLLSVSGLHVTLFAWLAQRLVEPLWRRSRRLPLKLAAPLAARWIGVLAALGFALFSGFGVPAQRTVWMLAAVAGLQTLGLRWPWVAVLLAAAVLVTAIDPWALMQPGFWLSFVAVGLLMASGSERAQGWRQHLWGALRSQWIATLGLTPLSLICFAQLSWVGLLANLVAIPLISFVVTPLALLGALAPPLWLLAAWLTRGLMAWLKLLASWPDAVWWVPAAPLWAQALALLGALLVVMPLPWRLRAAGGLCILPLLLPALALPPEGEFELLAPDIGQGNAVLIRTAHHALLFDSGPGYAPGADAGERVLLPLLRAQGVRRLDLLLLSHRDFDHVGGAASLARGLPVGELLSSLEAGHPLLSLGPPARRCLAGQTWRWDGVEFELLHPLPASYAGALKSNDLSCVLRVRSASGRAALLAGDLEADQERRLVRREIDLKVDVLLAPHHGSKTSSSAEFLTATAPRVALVQAAYRSRFGHPAPAILARYQALGIPVVTSAACGAWRWRSDAPLASASCERALSRHYWSDTVLPAVNPEPMGPWLPADEP